MSLPLILPCASCYDIRHAQIPCLVHDAHDIRHAQVPCFVHDAHGIWHVQVPCLVLLNWMVSWAKQYSEKSVGEGWDLWPGSLPDKFREPGAFRR